MATNYLDEALQFTSPEFTPVNYASPDSVDIDSASKYMTPETKVSSQLEQLLSGDSPLMKIAETRAKEQANQLGLLSSSMAVGAGQRELTKEMTPIAMQDAQSAVQFGTQQQQAEAQRQLDLQRGMVSGALQGQQAELQTGLIGAQGQTNQQLAQQQGKIQSQLQWEQGTINEKLQLLDQEFRKGMLDAELYSREYMQVIDNTFKENLAQMDIDSRSRESLVQYTAGLADRMMGEITNINQNKDMSVGAKATAIQALQTMYADEVATLGAIYGTTINWGDAGSPLAGWTGGTTGTTGTGGTAGTGGTPTINNLYSYKHALQMGAIPPPSTSLSNQGWGLLSQAGKAERQEYLNTYGVPESVFVAWLQEEEERRNYDY